MKVTNTGNRPRHVRVGSGITFLKAGETKDLDLKGKDLEQAKAVAVLQIEGAKSTAADDAEHTEKEQLIEELKAYGIEATTRSKVETLREKLEQAKAAKAE
jgi:hypothetical protein